MAAIAVLLVNAVAFAAVDTRAAKAKKRESARLVSVLPASDGVAIFESKRFLNDALPKVLAANQPLLADMMAKLTEMENRTGIDLRKFEQVAVGVSMNQISGTNIDCEPVAVASGDINAGALIAVAKLASKGTYREEKIGERTVYVFTAKDVMQKSTVTINNSKLKGIFDKGINGFTKEIAVATLDRNTLVLGTLSRVRETLEGKTHVSTDVAGLLSSRETAVMSFALKAPGGMSKMLPLENDELGNNIDSIQYLSGSLDVAAVGTTLQMLAKTKKPEQALGLKDTLEGLQVIGKIFLGGSKRADRQVYGRMLKSAKFEARGNDVILDLLVPQSDIDILVAGIK